MQIRVDFSFKPKGYREAAEQYFKQLADRKLPVFFEYDVPDLKRLSLVEKYNRLRIIHTDRIVATAPIPEVTDEGFVFDLTPFGPMGELLTFDLQYDAATRLIKAVDFDRNPKQYIKEILGFDLIHNI